MGFKYKEPEMGLLASNFLKSLNRRLHSVVEDYSVARVVSKVTLVDNVILPQHNSKGLVRGQMETVITTSTTPSR